MIIICAHCGEKHFKNDAHVRRSNKLNMKLFCSRKCFGLNRRLNKSIEQKKEDKRIYDSEYRAKNKDRLKVTKAEWFKNDYNSNPDKYKKKRKDKYGYHLEYLSSDKYKEYKKGYDKVFRAKKHFGEYWESSLLLVNISNEIDNKEANFTKGTYNKSQRRKRNQLY